MIFRDQFFDTREKPSNSYAGRLFTRGEWHRLLLPRRLNGAGYSELVNSPELQLLP